MTRAGLSLCLHRLVQALKSEPVAINIAEEMPPSRLTNFDDGPIRTARRRRSRPPRAPLSPLTLQRPYPTLPDDPPTRPLLPNPPNPITTP